MTRGDDKAGDVSRCGGEPDHAQRRQPNRGACWSSDPCRRFRRVGAGDPPGRQRARGSGARLRGPRDQPRDDRRSCWN